MKKLATTVTKALSALLVLFVVSGLLLVFLLGLALPGVDGFFLYLGLIGISSLGVGVAWFRWWRGITDSYVPALLLTLGLALVFLSIPTGSRACLASSGSQSSFPSVHWNWSAVWLLGSLAPGLGFHVPGLGFTASRCTSWLNGGFLVSGYALLGLWASQDKILENGIAQIGRTLHQILIR